jgi:hypothetical protein
VDKNWAGLQLRAIARDAGCSIEIVDERRLAELGIKASAGRFWYSSLPSAGLRLEGVVGLYHVLRREGFEYSGFVTAVGRIVRANEGVVLFVRCTDGEVLVRREVVRKAALLWGRSTIEGLLPVDPKGKGARLWFK